MTSLMIFASDDRRYRPQVLKADWIQLPVESYLAVVPTLKQGVIAGVFRIKGASPWAITRAEKLQVSVFLPNEQPMDDWYSGVYALPTVWPDVSMMGTNNLRKVVGYDFHHIRKCENHVRRLRTFFTVVLEPNIHTFSVLSETLPDFLKSKLCSTQQTLF